MKNVVVFITDQMRKDALGCYGNPYVHTPNLDGLAEKSIQFTRRYVANPICMPNRMSIISGMYPSNHGVWTNGLCSGDAARTVPAELKQYDYQTASIGKIHFGPYSMESANISEESEGAWEEVPDRDDYGREYFGFDYVEFTLGHTLAKSHYYRWFLQNGGRDEMFAVDETGPSYSPDERCGVRRMPSALSSTEFVGERAVHYLERVRDRKKPFYLSVSFPDPHHPYTSCYDDYEKNRGRTVQQPIGGEEDLKSRPPHYMQHFHGGWTRKGTVPYKHEGGIPKDIGEERIRHTYNMVEHIDRSVGKVLAALEQQGLMEETIILFLSDHGELLGDHGLWMKGPFFYEGLVNPPLLWYVPQIGHRIDDGLFSDVDIAPTLYDLLGFSIPAYADGVSQKEHLFCRDIQVRDSCMIEYRNGYWQDVNVNALVTERFKQVCYENGEEELTDLRDDPWEKENLCGKPKYLEDQRRLEKRLLFEKMKAKSKGAIQYGHA